MKRAVYAFLLIFLLPQPFLGLSMDTLTITEDTTLIDDHQGNIIIGANGVTLDCASFTVSGVGDGNGIELTNRSGVTVKNCRVEGFRHGFNISASSNNTFNQNISENNGRFGFIISDSSNNTFTQNSSGDNIFHGFRISLSNNNTFAENISENNGGTGFLLITNSDGNTFTENTSSGNGVIGFFVGGSSLNTFRENEGCNNVFFDAFDATFGSSNEWVNNNFCTTNGF